MSDFLKKVKSIFIVDDETLINAEKKSATTENKDTAKVEATTNTVPTQNSTTTFVPSDGKLNEKFVSVLADALSLANLEGIDYFEFKQSLKSLEKMPMDESTRMQSAFAMAQTMGATPEKLIQTATHYVSVLEKEKSKFDQSLSNQVAQQIQGKEDEVKRLQASNESIVKQIEQLNKQIEQNKLSMNQLTGELDTAKVKIVSTKNDFQFTFDHMVNTIKLDIENMKKFLK